MSASSRLVLRLYTSLQLAQSRLEGLERGAGSVRHDMDEVLSRGGDMEVGYCVGCVNPVLGPTRGPPAWAGMGCM
jgi:hypothetical protein